MWKLKGETEICRIWRINEDILDSQETTNQLREEIKTYFELNVDPEITSSTLWDAFKAVIRGKLINLNSIMQKKKNEKLEQLSKELEKFEKELKK